METGTAANCAEKRKCRKYAAPAEAHHFEPLAVESIASERGNEFSILSAGRERF